MYEFRDIHLNDRNAINQIREDYHNTLSSHSFPALYMWKEEMGLSLCLNNALFVIRRGAVSHCCYFFPCGDRAHVRTFIQHMLCLHGKSLMFQYIPESGKAFLEAEFPGVFFLSEDRDAFEYIFSSEEQAKLAGGKFKHIRKEIKHVKKERNFYLEVISSDNLAQVKAITLAWNSAHSDGTALFYADVEPVLSLIDAFSALGLYGVLIRDDMDYCGYVLGSPLSADTFDIHASKCSVNTEGLDYYCKQLFFQHIKSQFPYVNREEDLGIEGLRMRKMGLHPMCLTPIWKATVI